MKQARTPQLYWIDVQTPAGDIILWSFGAPTVEFDRFKKLGFPVSYGREGEKASKSYKWQERENAP